MAGIGVVAAAAAVSGLGGTSVGAAHAAAAAPRYTMTIGPAGTERYLGINDNGDIIGVGQEAGAQNGEGFIVKAGTNTLSFLSTPDDPGNTQQFTIPHAINNSGVVVGDVQSASSLITTLRPTRWPGPGPTGVDLGVDKPGVDNVQTSDVEATGISDNGHISGKTLTDRFSAWTVDGSTITKLPLLPGGREARANAVNNDGLVVGGATLPGIFPAVEWRNGQIINLGTLPGGTYAEAFAVNNEGVAVGVSTTTGGQQFGATHAVLFANGTITDLNVPGTGTDSDYANAINDNGVIVGLDRNGGYVYQNGVTTDLNTLIPPNTGYRIVNATGINDSGVIVGEATKPGMNGRTVAVKLTPINH
jgi:probable HAF family extracellular repeat protein